MGSAVMHALHSMFGLESRPPRERVALCVGVALAAAMVVAGCEPTKLGRAPAAPVAESAEPAPSHCAPTLPPPASASAAAAASASASASAQLSLASPPPAVADVLSDEYERRHRRRARLSRDTTLRTRVEAPVPSQPTPAERNDVRLVVTEQVGRNVRVVVESPIARVLLWAAEEQFARVVVRRAPVEPTPVEREVPTVVGAFVMPGLPLEGVMEMQGMARVSVADGTVRFAGWAPLTALGRLYYEPSDRAPEGAWGGLVARAVTLTDAPNGRRLADVSPGAEVWVLDGPRRGFQLVSLVGDGYELVGFVPANALELRWDRGRGFGVGDRNVVGSDETLKVAAGTCLYDRSGGSVIGVTRRWLAVGVAIPRPDDGFREFTPYLGGVSARVFLRRSDAELAEPGATRPKGERALPLPLGKWSCGKPTGR